jgi:hypothetical protein
LLVYSADQLAERRMDAFASGIEMKHLGHFLSRLAPRPCVCHRERRLDAEGRKEDVVTALQRQAFIEIHSEFVYRFCGGRFLSGCRPCRQDRVSPKDQREKRCRRSYCSSHRFSP